MGRLNWIWRALWTLSITVGVFGAPARLAAFTSDDNTVRNELLGQCLIHHSVNYEKQNARLTVFEPGRFGRGENVGGGNATYGTNFNIPTPLTLEFLTI